MIEMSFEELSILVIGGIFSLMALLLFVHSSSERRDEKKRNFQIMKCPVCGELFDDRTNVRMPKCLGCGRKTLRADDKSLG